MKLNNIFEIYNKTLKENLVNENLILEYAQGKNNKRAREFIKSNYPQYINKQVTLPNGNKVKLDAAGWTREIRDTIPASRFPVRISPETGEDIDSCRLLLGVTRIYFDLLDSSQLNNTNISGKLSKLNQIINLVVDEYLDKYDRDLNGLNFNELDKEFSSELKQNLEKRKAAVKAIGLTKTNRKKEYTFKQIPDFNTANEYEGFTEWCITTEEDLYDQYTKDGLGIFYFCLKDGYEKLNEPDKPGEGAPLDEYGKSMFAISVNEDGSLNSCTCRWNFDHGADDNMIGDEVEISEFFGVDFFETFKPWDFNEILSKIKNDAIPSEIAKKQKGIETKTDLFIIVDKKIKQYTKCYDNDNIKCFAYDKFYWFDAKTGEEIDPPKKIIGTFKCHDCKLIVSLEGSPQEVDGMFMCDNNKYLASLEGGPIKVKDYFGCTGCESLTSLKGAPKEVGGDFNCNSCTSLTSLEGAPKIVNGNFSCRECSSLTSLDGAPQKVNGDFNCILCKSLNSLKGAPKKVKDFDCSGCVSLTSLKYMPQIITDMFSCSRCILLTSLEGSPKKIEGSFTCGEHSSKFSLNGAPEVVKNFYCRDEHLTSLEGAPKIVNGDFSCRGCISLSSLEGAPKEVGGTFSCSNCDSLTSLEGAPEKVDGDFYCSNCKSLTSLKGAPKIIKGNYYFHKLNKITSNDIGEYGQWLYTNPIKNYLVNNSIEESYVKYIASNFTRLF